MLQVSAQLRYRLPRLTGLGTQLSRLGGGIGTRGPGDKAGEQGGISKQDRAIKRKMKEIERHRSLYRRAAKPGSVVAAAGYTNAGNQPC